MQFDTTAADALKLGPTAAKVLKLNRIVATRRNLMPVAVKKRTLAAATVQQQTHTHMFQLKNELSTVIVQDEKPKISTEHEKIIGMSL